MRFPKCTDCSGAAHEISSTAAWSLALHLLSCVQVIFTILLYVPVGCTDFEMFQNLLKQNLVPGSFCMVVNYWKWQLRNLTVTILTVFMGRSKNMMLVWSQNREKTWEKPRNICRRKNGLGSTRREVILSKCVMRSTVHCLWKRSLWFSCSFVQCESQSFTPICWGQIRNFFIKPGMSPKDSLYFDLVA